MTNYTKEDILKLAKSEDVRYIRLQFSDMLGTVKCVEIPFSRLEDALNNRVMFDGSSIEGFVRIKEADMFLKPDLNTWLILSFEDDSYGKVARLICDIHTPDGKPFEGASRYILKAAIKRMNEMGFATLNIGFEPEFFLFKNDSNGQPTLMTSDNGGYFDMSPIDGAEYCRRDITLELEKLGFVVEANHHEVAPGQHEICFHFADVLSACDNVQTFKQVVKHIARRHGLTASFMPKPIAGISGSGMHTNCSLANYEGKNIFFDEKEPFQLSITCRKWINGILKHARSLAGLCNPTINSYKRIIPGYEAPCYACWSDANRSAMIRIPAARGSATRTEIRNVDPMANPYLALAAILNAGLDGIEEDAELVPPVYDNIFDLTREEREEKGIINLPENLKDAIKEMRKDPLIIRTLGQHTFKKYISAKEQEWDEYRRVVTEWELSKYLDK